MSAAVLAPIKRRCPARLKRVISQDESVMREKQNAYLDWELIAAVETGRWHALYDSLVRYGRVAPVKQQLQRRARELMEFASNAGQPHSYGWIWNQ